MMCSPSTVANQQLYIQLRGSTLNIMSKYTDLDNVGCTLCNLFDLAIINRLLTIRIIAEDDVLRSTFSIGWHLR